MKKIMLTIALALFSTIMFAQNKNYQLSSHILDVSKGTPASNISIKLEKYNENTLLSDKKLLKVNYAIHLEA